MTIETIKAIVAQGAQAFANGKKTETNPYVNNPEHHMHWLTGYNQAALGAAPQAEEQQQKAPETETEGTQTETESTQTETEGTQTETESTQTETEGTQTEDEKVEQVEAKASKKSKE